MAMSCRILEHMAMVCLAAGRRKQTAVTLLTQKSGPLELLNKPVRAQDLASTVHGGGCLEHYQHCLRGS